ncbi:alpha/beta hydrolase family protein [Kluyvera ascorbata]|uniref:alpha/beta hydrolase family protein n=1 Tax=Kluyvera ascorbata TaxID=51288 RepID=UPI00289FA3BA|nr:alpha/beta hydrolase [Kluyvera ascorbata]
MNNSQANALIDGMAELFAHSVRTPILHYPDEYGMEYEDVFFPAQDGVILEGWFIPAKSKRLVICNHCMPANRSGFPGHLEPWKSLGFGDFEVNFLPKYKALHDAGYNVLVYDMRNHGRSGSGSGGLVGHGTLEYRDVIGSIRYAKSRPDTANMKTALLSVCLGANATINGMHKHPEEFTNIRTLFALQPVTAGHFVEVAMERAGIPDGYDRLNEVLYQRTGLHLKNMWPTEYAKAVTVPTLVAQVHDDFTIRPSLIEEIYGFISAKDKALFWIEGTDQRFQGYNYFGKDPQVMLEWFDRHM